jgi:hypothetical protein
MAYSRLERFDDADRTVEYVMENKLPLSDYGYTIYFDVKGEAATGRGNFPLAIQYFEQSFKLIPSESTILKWMLAAALGGDLPQFFVGDQLYRQKLPDLYERSRFRADALELYLLAKGIESGKLPQSSGREKLQQLVSKWKPNDLGRETVSTYWSRFPGGREIAANWRKLLND